MVPRVSLFWHRKVSRESSFVFFRLNQQCTFHLALLQLSSNIVLSGRMLLDCHTVLVIISEQLQRCLVECLSIDMNSVISWSPTNRFSVAIAVLFVRSLPVFIPSVKPCKYVLLISYRSSLCLRMLLRSFHTLLFTRSFSYQNGCYSICSTITNFVAAYIEVFFDVKWNYGITSLSIASASSIVQLLGLELSLCIGISLPSPVNPL